MRRLAGLLLLLVLAGCGGAAEPAANELLGPAELVERLRDGGLVVYVRHAHTDRSRDDRGLVDVDDCSTQRLLSDRGREQARELGRAVRALRIPVGDVLSSEYCRTRETAKLAFGRYRDEPDLTGFPNEDDPDRARRVDRTRELLGAPAGADNTILVAHVHNLEAAANVEIDEGDIAVFEPRGEGAYRYLGWIPASAWPQLVDELG